MSKVFSATDKRRCVRRELAFRRRVYARWVARGDMTQEDADREIAIMEAIEADYERIIIDEGVRPQLVLGIDDDPIDIIGPLPLKADAFLKATIFKRLEEAQAAGEMPPRHMLPHDESALLFIGPGDDPHGFVSFFETYPKIAWLDVLYVRPEFRRRGYGGLLLRAFEQLLRAESFRLGELGTELHNAGMHRLSQRLGWKKKGYVMELAL